MEPEKYNLIIINHKINNNHAEYLLRLLNNNEIVVEFYERYSVLKTLHDNLKKEISSNNFPKFPPKKFFLNTEEKFLNQRQTELNTYFELLFKNKDFVNLPSLKKFINNSIKKYAKNKKPTNNNNNEINNNQTNNNENIITTNSDNNDSKSKEIKSKLNFDMNRYKTIIDSAAKNFIELNGFEHPDEEIINLNNKEYNRIVLEKKVFEKKNYIFEGDNENLNLLNNNELDDNKYDFSNELNKYDNYVSNILPNLYKINDIIVEI